MKRIASPLLTILLITAAASCLTACSFKSFSASSRSSSSPCRWSSASSRPARAGSGEASVLATQDSFLEQVSAITVLYAKSRGAAAEYQGEIGAAAQRHGITFWEGNTAVYQAIGRGLGRAQVPREAIPHLPFLQDLKTSALYSHILTGHGR
jgi:hypothetical protein